MLSAGLHESPFFHASVAVLLLSGGELAQPAKSGPPIPAPTEFRAPAGSPLAGTWELDLARLPRSYGTPPKRVTYSFEDAGSGAWLANVDIVAQDGSVRHGTVRYRNDGRAVPAEGNTGEADSAAFSSPAPNVLVMSLSKDKGFVSVRVYAVSPDEQEMTEAAAAVDESGAPYIRNYHFRRIR